MRKKALSNCHNCHAWDFRREKTRCPIVTIVTLVDADIPSPKPPPGRGAGGEAGEGMPTGSGLSGLGTTCRVLLLRNGVVHDRIHAAFVLDIEPDEVPVELRMFTLSRCSSPRDRFRRCRPSRSTTRGSSGTAGAAGRWSKARWARNLPQRFPRRRYASFRWCGCS